MLHHHGHHKKLGTIRMWQRSLLYDESLSLSSPCKQASRCAYASRCSLGGLQVELDSEVLLIGVEALVLLDLLLDPLSQLLDLALGQRLLPLDLVGVTSRVGIRAWAQVLLDLLVHLLLTLDAELALHHEPEGAAHLLNKVAVVRDNDHTTLKLGDGLGQRAERVAVQVVGGLVKDEHVRLPPHGRGQHHLHLLAT